MIQHFLPHLNRIEDFFYGFSYFCPVCGEVWGQLQTSGCTLYQVARVRCKRHWVAPKVDIHGLAPGSLLLPLVCRYGAFEFEFDKLLAKMTDEHLRYEFQQALEWAERK